VKLYAPDTTLNGKNVQQMDSKVPSNSINWPEIYLENQLYLKANVLTFQLAFISIPLLLGFGSLLLLIFVQNSFGQSAAAIIAIAILPSLAVFWWMGNLFQSKHFVVYKGQIKKAYTQKLYNQTRPMLNIELEERFILKSDGLHELPNQLESVDLSAMTSDIQFEDNQSSYFLALESKELIEIFPTES
jgi:hypothetical protein